MSEILVEEVQCLLLSLSGQRRVHNVIPYNYVYLKQLFFMCIQNKYFDIKEFKTEILLG